MIRLLKALKEKELENIEEESVNTIVLEDTVNHNNPSEDSMDRLLKVLDKKSIVEDKIPLGSKIKGLEERITKLTSKPAKAIYQFEVSNSIWLFQLDRSQYEVWDVSDYFKVETLLIDGFILGFKSINEDIALVIEAKEKVGQQIENNSCEYSQIRKIGDSLVHFQIFFDYKEDKYYPYRYNEEYKRILISDAIEDIGIASQKIEEYIESENKKVEEVIERKEDLPSNFSKTQVTWELINDKLQGTIGTTVFTIENNEVVKKVKEEIKRLETRKKRDKKRKNRYNSSHRKIKYQVVVEENGLFKATVDINNTKYSANGETLKEVKSEIKKTIDRIKPKETTSDLKKKIANKLGFSWKSVKEITSGVKTWLKKQNKKPSTKDARNRKFWEEVAALAFA